MNRGTPQRLLVVLDDCGPGDALVVDFCLEALLRAYPGAEADLLVGEQAATVFAHDRRFRRVIRSRLYEQRARRRFMLAVLKACELARLVTRLLRRYDRAITFYWGTTLLNVLVRAVTRGPSFGYANALPRLLDARLGRYRPAGDPLEQAVRLMEAAGVEAAPALPIPRTTDRGERLETVLEEHGLAAGAKIAVLHAGSDWACQQWRPERWAVLADQLVGELGVRVVFTGTRGEQRYIDEIRAMMRTASVSLAGRTGVPELATLLQRAALCVCVDSLPFELAQMAGTPTVVLAGQSRTAAGAVGGRAPLVVNRTAPDLRAAILDCKLSFEKAAYGGCRHHACPMAGLRGIEVEDVMTTVRKALDEGVDAHTRTRAVSP